MRRRTTTTFTGIAATRCSPPPVLARGPSALSPRPRRAGRHHVGRRRLGCPQPVTPGRLHGLRLRPVPGPEPVGDGRLAAASRRTSRSASTSPAPPAACRVQPNLTPTWVTTQLRQRLAAAPDHARPAGLLQPALPALRQRPRINADPGATGATPRPAGRARPRRDKTVAAAQALGHLAGQHALVRPRGLRRHQHRAAASRRWRSSAPGPSSSTPSRYVSGVYSSAGSGIRMLDEARVKTARRRTTSPTRSGSRAGTARPTRPRRTSATRGWQPGGRMKQYRGGHNETVRRGHDQHRPRLPRPRLAPTAPPVRATTATACRSTSPTTRGSRRLEDPRRLVKALSACSPSRRRAPGGHRRAGPAGRPASVNAWQKAARPPGRAAMDPPRVDDAARDRTAAGAEARLDRRGRTRPPAGPQRRARRDEPRRSPAPSTSDPAAVAAWQPSTASPSTVSRRRVVGRSRNRRHLEPTLVSRAAGRGAGSARRSARPAPAKKPRPSVPAPVRSSTACSGCGIRPTTLPRSLVMPAMSCSEPLGLSSR